MWNIETEARPVLIRANRIIAISSKNYMNKTGNQGIKETQKTHILALWIYFEKY
jgi:hypothetical protein